MLLVERYVEAVRRHLPRNQRDDIAAELRDTLRSQVDAAETDAGRPLSDEDVTGILRRYGAPDVVAARYGEPRYLIGPGIYPYYKVAVKVLLWVLGSLLTVALIVTAFTLSDPVAAMTRIVWTGVLIVVANLTIVTLIFAHLERMRDHVTWSRRWDPRDLLDDSGKRLSIPRAEAGAALLLTVFWLLWWTDALLLAFALLVAVSIGSTLRQWTVLEKRRGEADSGAASPSRP